VHKPDENLFKFSDVAERIGVFMFDDLTHKLGDAIANSTSPSSMSSAAHMTLG
jgi:hypothetical protein